MNTPHSEQEIKKFYLARAKKFIADYLMLEGKEFPEELSEEQIIVLHVECMQKLDEEIMWHRNKPIETDRLNKIAKLSGLPLHTKIILDSLNPENELQNQTHKTK